MKIGDKISGGTIVGIVEAYSWIDTMHVGTIDWDLSYPGWREKKIGYVWLDSPGKNLSFEQFKQHQLQKFPDMPDCVLEYDYNKLETRKQLAMPEDAISVPENTES